MINFKIEPFHKEYLAVQRGDIAHLLGDSATWRAAYDQAIEDTYQSLVPFLPKRCDRFLDIGSGLGGIDVAVAKHYGFERVTIHQLDGIEEPSVVVRQDQPFNNFAVAADFLVTNGVRAHAHWGPEARPTYQAGRYDLIMSFASWCFHYPPSEYLDMVRECSRRGTVLIIDVRSARPMWENTLVKAFGSYRVAHEARKYKRLVFTL